MSGTCPRLVLRVLHCSTPCITPTHADPTPHKSGGNSIRVWIFVEGQSIPSFASDGTVTATDGAKTLSADLLSFLRFAAEQDVFVVLCLWNGAVFDKSKDANLFGLLSDEAKLQSFLDNALAPLVSALKAEPALAAWWVWRVWGDTE